MVVTMVTEIVLILKMEVGYITTSGKTKEFADVMK